MLSRNAGRLELELTWYTEFPLHSLYKRMILTLPAIQEVGGKTIRDVVHAVKAVPQNITAQGIKKGSAARLSTVLIRTQAPDTIYENSIKRMDPLAGVGVAEVRAIFRLPEQFGNCNTPLAYVHWMKPLCEPVPSIHMYEVSFSSHNRRPQASVIPLYEIIWTCHLISVFSQASASVLRWTADTVLSEAPSFISTHIFGITTSSFFVSNSVYIFRKFSYYGLQGKRHRPPMKCAENGVK